MALTVVDHPLVADRVLTPRDERTKSVDFRRIARIFTGVLDTGLDGRAFILPGLGDAGDRLSGAGSA